MQILSEAAGGNEGKIHGAVERNSGDWFSASAAADAVKTKKLMRGAAIGENKTNKKRFII